VGGEQGIFAAVDSLAAAIQHGLLTAGVDLESGPVDVAALTTSNPTAYRAYVRGVDLLNRAERVEAAKALAEAVQADSTFALAWYYLGVATWWSEDFQTAQRVIDKAVRSGRLTGREREGLDALRDLIQANYASAAKRYRALLERYPDDKEFLYGLGEALFHQGDDYAGARSAFDRTVALDPTFAVAFQHIVDIDVESGSMTAVVADCDRLQRLNPTNLVPTALKMDGIGRLGDAAGAAAVAREMLAREPGNPAALRQLAIYSRMTGQFDSAAVYTRLTEKSNADPIMSGGVPFWLLLSEGRYREAERKSAEVMRQFDFAQADIRDVTIPGGRVRLLVAMKRFDEAWPLALQTYSLMRRYVPQGGGPLTWLAQMALSTGHDVEARRLVAQYDAYLRGHPSRVERRGGDYLAGLVALREGRFRDAVRLLDSGSYTGPPPFVNQENDWARARAHLAIGDRDRAVALLRRVASRGPYNGDSEIAFPAMVLLAQQYEAAGQRDEALDLYRRVAYQYRLADPGVPANEEARAAIARLERSRAQASANR
jgi:tetratricopeptide (TPR) repeat protein